MFMGITKILTVFIIIPLIIIVTVGYIYITNIATPTSTTMQKTETTKTSTTTSMVQKTTTTKTPTKTTVTPKTTSKLPITTITVTPENIVGEKTLNIEYEVLEFPFKNLGSMEKEIVINGSVLVYYKFKISAIMEPGKNPTLVHYFKVGFGNGSTIHTAYGQPINLRDPSEVKGKHLSSWIYIPRGNLNLHYNVNITAHRAKVSGTLEIVLVKPVSLNYNVKYFVKNSPEIVLFTIVKDEDSLLYVEKTPSGGSIEVLQPISESSYVITSFSENHWTPTGIVSGLSKTIVPSYVIVFGGRIVNGTAINGGWLERRFTSEDTYIVLLNPGSEFSLRMGSLDNMGSPKATYNIVSHDIILPMASHAEGVLFNITVDRAPSQVVLELTPIFSSKKPENIWVGADLVNSSGYVVSTTPLEYISSSSNKVFVKLVAPSKGEYIISLSYATMEPYGVGFYVKFLGLKTVDLGTCEFEKDWGVWKGEVKTR